VSDTPRTDAAAIRCACSTYVVPSGFARELERENAALRKDKERMDWIARNRSISATERPWSVTPESLRESIDAAMKEVQP
jgi:hypothetical protein